jgi:hypothetical protein
MEEGRMIGLKQTAVTLLGPLAACILVGGIATFAQAAPFTLQHTFDDPTPTDGDNFGYSVSVSGDNVLVGAYQDGTASATGPNGGDVGQAHLFSATTGSLLQTFNDPTPIGTDNFGFSVSVSGDNVLIGANADDTKGVNVGQAHLFSAATGVLLRTFNDPTITTSDEFGYSVSISGDNVLIGARNDDTKGAGVGQAHLFSASTGSLLQTFNDPTPTTSDGFGHSVSISGNNVLIGAVNDDTMGFSVGQVHLFSAATGDLLRTFNDPTVTASDEFGHSVSISGDDVLIGAFGDDTSGVNSGQAYLFSAATGNLLQTFNNPTPATSDNFGFSVSISSDNVLIGARGDETMGFRVGQAYLFSAGTGDLIETLDDPTPVSSDNFGAAVSVSGNNVLVGAFGHVVVGQGAIGQAHLFSAAQVPEPSTLVILGVGLLCGGVLRRYQAMQHNYVAS